MPARADPADATDPSRARQEAPSGADAQFDAFVHQAVDDWRALPLSQPVRALLELVENLTLRPADCNEADIASLRAVGWTDRDIHDAVQVASYFNYINRVADALGVKDEPEMPRWGRDGVMPKS